VDVRALWGVGGLTFGLTMRYLGMSLGMGVALGFCAAFGTLVPPIFKGQLAGIAATGSGKVILAGVAICLCGIAIAALAGLSKEREMTEANKKAAIKEFNFPKGMMVAVFSGIMSACFAYGLDAGAPISELSAAAGTSTHLDGAAQARRRPPRRIHDQCHLVRGAQHPQQDRLPVPGRRSSRPDPAVEPDPVPG
jgi:hypothetical protein